MTDEIENIDRTERNHGEQPIAALMIKHELAPHDLVVASAVQMNHKMVNRAVKGRRLTVHTKNIILNALNRATGESYHMVDLFNY